MQRSKVICASADCFPVLLQPEKTLNVSYHMYVTDNPRVIQNTATILTKQFWYAFLGITMWAHQDHH